MNLHDSYKAITAMGIEVPYLCECPSKCGRYKFFRYVESDGPIMREEDAEALMCAAVETKLLAVSGVASYVCCWHEDAQAWAVEVNDLTFHGKTKLEALIKAAERLVK